MPKTRTVVKTTDNLNSELGKLAAEVLKDWFDGDDYDLPNIILASMAVVEKYSVTFSKLESQDKYQAAQSLAPIIVDLLVSWEKISAEDGEALKKKLSRSVDLIKGIVNVAIYVSKHPSVIQLEELVKEKTKGCFTSCRGKKEESN